MMEMGNVTSMDICISPCLIIDLFAFVRHTTLGTMTPAELVGVTAVTIEYVVGMALSMYILLVYRRNLKSGPSLGPSDKIHLTKILVHVSLHVIFAAQSILYVFWPQLFLTEEVFLWIIMITMFLVMYTYWLTAVLCVYYCTNITTSSHRTIIWMKRNLTSYLLHVLLLLGLGTFAISIPAFWFCKINRTGNSTDQSLFVKGTFLNDTTYKTTSTILGCFLPFTIAFISTTFAAWSLINHMRRMKENNWGVSKFQTQINATRTMVLFLLISVIYNITQILYFTIPATTPEVVAITIWFVQIYYPISEAIIIIQSSSKLRKNLVGKIFYRKRRNGETET